MYKSKTKEEGLLPRQRLWKVDKDYLLKCADGSSGWKFLHIRREIPYEKVAEEKGSYTVVIVERNTDQ